MSEPEHPPGGACRAATISGLAALGIALGLWLAQAAPVPHLPPAGLFAAFSWLVAYARCTLKIAGYARRPDEATRVLLIGAALGAAPRRTIRPPTRYEGFIARRAIYRACGYAGAIAVALMGAANIGMLVGVVDLTGVNRALFTILMLTIASECVANRVLGPQVAAADLAERQVVAAEKIAARRGLTVIDGGAGSGARGA